MNKEILRNISLAALLLGAILAIAGCGAAQTATPEPTEVQEPTLAATATVGQPEAEETFVIAVAGPQTGPNAVYGEFHRTGARLAAHEINEAGGTDGHPIEIKLMDDQMDPKQSPLVAQRIADDDSVLAVIGHFASTNSLAAAPIYGREGVPHLTACSTSDSLSGISPWFFRVPTPNRELGRQLGLYATQVLGANRIGVMYGESEGALTTLEAFEKGVEQGEGEIIERLTHQLGDQDFTSQITKMMAADPDVVWLDTFTNEAGLLVKQMGEAGWNPTVLGLDAWTNMDFIKLAGSAGEGALSPAFWDPESPNPESQQFVSQYQEMYGKLPEQFTAHTYVCVKLIAKALENGARTRVEIQEYLHETGTSQGFDTIVGKIVWDENHDSVNPIVMLEVKDGEWTRAPKQIELED